MEFDDVVNSRRSIRCFLPTEVPDTVVEYLIGRAMKAPSSMNGQPWRFIIIRDEETKRQLAEIKDRHCPPEKREFPAGFLLQAPVIVLTCVERARAFDRGMESGILATGHLMLAAASRGLATVYLSAYKLGTPEVADDIRHLLQIPADVDPVTIVPVGYPAGPAEPKFLPPAKEVIFRDAYGHR